MMSPIWLRRLRWAVRAVMLLGVAVSVAANVLHADTNPISQAISAWPPIALLLTVELISRVPAHRRSLAVVRFAATTVIAGIAAWVSYWHMAGVALRYGETGASAYLLPLSVDGLIVVASISLVEIATSLRTNARTETSSPAAGNTGRSAAERGRPSAKTVATRPAAPGAGNAPGINAPEDGRRPDGTAALVAYWRTKDPQMHPAVIGERIGKTERTVRRYLKAPAVPGQHTASAGPAAPRAVAAHR